MRCHGITQILNTRQRLACWELALEYDHEAFEVHCSLCVDLKLGLEQAVTVVVVL